MSKKNLEISSESELLVNAKTGEVIGTTPSVTTSPDQLAATMDGLAKIQAGQFRRGINMVGEYYEFESVGQSVRGCYLGLKTIEITDSETKQRKELLAAFWISQDEKGNPKVYNNGGVAIIEAFQALQQKSFFELTYTGKKGKMKKYEVIPLVLD